jgi:dihydroflavonol-4-reductase
VFGPGYKNKLSESQQVLFDVMSGKFPMMMDLHWATVDVRDVAKAHIMAMENDKATGRYICSNEEVHFTAMCKILHKKFPDYKVPTTDGSGWFGSTFMYLASYTQPHNTGTYIRTNLGMKYNLNNSKIKTELGMEFLPLETTITDTVNFFIDQKLLDKK